MDLQRWEKKFTRPHFLRVYFYFGLIGICLALMAATIYLASNVSHQWLLLSDQHTTSDFMESLSYLFVANPYKGYWASGELRWSIYLPFAYYVLTPFGLLAQSAVRKYLGGFISLDLCYQNPVYFLTYLLYFTLHLVLILFLLGKRSGLKGKDLSFFLAGTAFHSGVFFCFGRGNVMLTTFLFALLFFLYRDSKKWWVRELSYLALAGAIAIKVYPIIIALLFVHERKWLALLRTAIYTAVLVFLPFLLIEGGFSSIPLFVSRVLDFGDASRGLGLSNVSVANFVAKLFYAVGRLFNVDLLPASKTVALILSSALLALTATLACFPKKKGDELPFLLLLLSCYMLFQTVSYAYVFIFYTYVGLLLVQRFDSLPKQRKFFYLASFLIIAQPLPLFWHLAFFGAVANAMLFAFSAYDLIKMINKDAPGEDVLSMQEQSSPEEKAA